MKKNWDKLPKYIPTVSIQSTSLCESMKTITKFDEDLPCEIKSRIKPEDGIEPNNPCISVPVSSNSAVLACSAVALKPSVLQKDVNQALLTEALISILCKQYEKDDEKANLLFQTICSQVSKLNIIPGFKVNMGPLRSYFQESLEGLIIAAHSLIHNTSDNKNIIYSSPASKLINQMNVVQVTSSRISKDNYMKLNLNVIHTSRIKKEFEDISLIAKGGGGVVYKAKCIIDGCWYAIKKIPLIIDVNYEWRFEKIVKEVLVLANLNHPNIVGYKTAWIDSCYEAECTCKGSSDESFMLSSDVQLTSFKKSDESTDDGVIFDDRIESIKSQRLIPISGEHSLKDTMGTSASIEEAVATPLTIKHAISSPPLKRRLSRSLSCESTGSVNSFETTALNEYHTSSSISNIYTNQALEKLHILTPAASKNSSFLRNNIEILIPKTHTVLIIQMELCSGTLRKWLDDRNDSLIEKDVFACVNEGEVMQIFKEILHGINHFHLENVIHRDLKPSNIFFDMRSHLPKIGDFGLATAYGRSEKMKTKINGAERTCRIGTPPYVSPEQMNCKNYDQKTDMYSLGIILVELLYPFKTVMERSRCIDEIKEGIMPPPFLQRWPNQAALVTQLLSENPKERPSAKEILHSDFFKQFNVDKVPSKNSQETAELIAKLEQSKSEIDVLKSKMEEMKLENDELQQSKSENDLLKLKIQELQLEIEKLKAARAHQRIKKLFFPPVL